MREESHCPIETSGSGANQNFSGPQLAGGSQGGIQRAGVTWGRKPTWVYKAVGIISALISFPVFLVSVFATVSRKWDVAVTSFVLLFACFALCAVMFINAYYSAKLRGTLKFSRKCCCGVLHR